MYPSLLLNSAPQNSRKNLNLIPLINAIFLLLTFFLICGVVDGSSLQSVSVPTAENPEETPKGLIKLSISADGALLLDDEVTDLQSLRHVISGMISQNPDIGVTLAADKSSKAQLLLKVMGELRTAGVKNLSLVTESPQ